MSKQVRSNKEPKKPKQQPKVVPPPTGGPNAPILRGLNKPHQFKK